MVNLEAAVCRPPDFGDGERESGANLRYWGGRRRGAGLEVGDGSGSADGLRIRPRCESWGCTNPQAALAVAETSFELHKVELRRIELLTS